MIISSRWPTTLAWCCIRLITTLYSQQLQRSNYPPRTYIKWLLIFKPNTVSKKTEIGHNGDDHVVMPRAALPRRADVKGQNKRSDATNPRKPEMVEKL